MPQTFLSLIRSRTSPGPDSRIDTLAARVDSCAMRCSHSLLAVICSLAAAVSSPAAPAGKPNVVFILADDLGWRDTETYGSTYYDTPNVARLAERGMTFANAYAASPLCSPTRASILTGQNPARLRFTTPAGHEVRMQLDPKLPASAPPDQKAVTPDTCTRLSNDYFTIGEAMKEGGYTTAFMGKWHLGRAPYIPEKQGFDVVVGGREHPGPPPPGHYFAPWAIDTIPKKPKGTHICDEVTDEALEFIEKNKEKPFFLELWYYDVHAPYQAKEDLKAKYAAKTDPQGLQKSPTMGGMIDIMDQNIGRVIDKLDALGLAENTIVVFTSDNGGNMYDEVDGTTPTNNAPLRNGKGNIYEGGQRVPLIAVWPGRIAPKSKSDALTSTVDWYPTLLEMVGLQPHADIPLDGVSILPALEGKPFESPPVFCHFPHYVAATKNLPGTSVRRGDDKLIRYYADGPEQQDRLELYHLAEDIGETNNLAEQKPELAAELNGLITGFLVETKALVPKPNPQYDPKFQGKTLQDLPGWHAGGTATAEVQEKRLVLTATGDDPQIQTGEVPALSGQFTLQFRVKSDAKGEGQVFWTTKKFKSFNRARSGPVEVTHDGQWHACSVQIEVGEELTSLRIDPSQAPGKIEFEDIRLVDGGGDIVKEWSFQ